jgi:hypothetical protein
MLGHVQAMWAVSNLVFVALVLLAVVLSMIITR